MIAVVATDKNNGIGINNQLLCHLPDDLKHFKKLTLNNVVVMGRKTYESIGKALPQRINVVLTTNKDIAISDAEVFNNIQDVLSVIPQKYPDKKIIIIGGEQIYRLFYPYLKEIHRTLIHHSFNADAFFPDFENDFDLVNSVFHPKDEKHLYDFEFQHWKRK
ncbi:MAG: dihydrofolate reductase DfrA [Bacteroidia bacterium]